MGVWLKIGDCNRESKLKRFVFAVARRVARPCRAFAVTRTVGQLIPSSSELAWPRQRVPDTRGISGGHVSLGRINNACAA